MRKIITSSVLILLFTMFSGQVFAGKYDECKEFKKSKGLYGLCNAYQNALLHEDQDAMDDISSNWDKKVGEDGLPELPNRDDGDVCPCWDAEILADLTEGLDGAYCRNTVDYDEANYADNVPFFEAGLDPSGTGYCIMSSPFTYIEFSDADQIAECRAGVRALQESVDADGNDVFPLCTDY